MLRSGDNISCCLTMLTVAQMSKQKKWKDVRLLSFDLQTVEFTYAEVIY